MSSNGAQTGRLNSTGSREPPGAWLTTRPSCRLTRCSGSRTDPSPPDSSLTPPACASAHSNPRRAHPGVDSYRPKATRRPRSPSSRALGVHDHDRAVCPVCGHRQARRPPLHPEKRPLTCSNVELKGLEPSTPCITTTGSPVSPRPEAAGVASDLLRAGLGHDRDRLGMTAPRYRDLPGCLDPARPSSHGLCGHFLSTRTPCARCTARLAARACWNQLPHHHQVKSRRPVRWAGLIRAGRHGLVRR